MIKEGRDNIIAAPCKEKKDKDNYRFHALDRRMVPAGLYYVRYEDNKNGLMVLYPTTDLDLQEYFYNINFTNIDFVNKFGITKNMFDEKFLVQGGAKYLTNWDTMADADRVFLYNFIQKIKPEKVIEFSSCNGHSTVTIAKALLDINKEPVFFETHELEQKYANNTDLLLYDYDIDFVTVNQGDVLETMDRDKLKEVDFLFVDSDHSKEFTERYIEDFFPLLKKGCWVGVHDMRFHPDYLTDETSLVKSYIEDSNIKEYFHVADLLKMFKLTCEAAKFEHCCGTMLLFFRV